MRTHCTGQQLIFQPLAGRKVVADFSAGPVSSDGGALLLRELDERLGLTAAVAKCFTDHRRGPWVEHTVVELLRQRIYGLCLDYEDLNDHDRLRHDPLFAAAVGKRDPAGDGRLLKRDEGKALAGKSTLNRLELTTADASEKSRYKKVVANHDDLEQFFAKRFIESYGTDVPERLVLDFDASDIKLHGEQEGRFYHGYYKSYCYLPLYLFCGEQLLVAKLRKADIDGCLGTTDVLKWLVPMLRARWPDVEIVVRGDGGFARDEIFTWCEANHVDFVIGYSSNPRLLAEIVEQQAKAAARHKETGKAAREFADLNYRTKKSWTRARRVVAKAEELPGKANPRFIVTSYAMHEMGGAELYEFEYCARGEMENRIKEKQLDLFGTRTSCTPLRANQLRVWFSAVAYTLMVEFRRIALAGTKLNRAQAKTIRVRLLKVAARVRVSARRVYVQFSSVFPMREVLEQAFANIQAWQGLPT